MYQTTEQELNNILNLISQTIVHAKAVPVINKIQQSFKKVEAEKEVRNEKIDVKK